MAVTVPQAMRMALTLAARGGRAVVPNPMVGAVILRAGRVIGRGYHRQFGGPHAEAEAIRSVRRPKDLRGATLVVSLEPCRHHGKTPPCADLIERVGIARVVAGIRDPFQQRAGKRRLYRLEFMGGVLERECLELNRFFFTWVTKRRPFVTAKIAVSADGFVAGPGGKRMHITDRKQDVLVHRARALHQAIVVGSQTVLNDNPRLTVRTVKGADPLRVIVDSRLRVPLGSRVFKDSNVLVATCASLGSARAREFKKNGIRLWHSPGQRVDLKKLLRHLASLGISSVLAEPGPTLYGVLKKARLIDRLEVMRGRKRLHQGLLFPGR